MLKKLLKLFFYKYDKGIYRIYRICGIKIITKPYDLVINLSNTPKNIPLSIEYNTIISCMQLINNTNICNLDYPNVSVIIPVYNTGDFYLRKCLYSVINQTLKNIEIIIINDNSPNIEDENTILEFIKIDKRIKYIKNEKNIGAMASRIKGIKLAVGHSIAFVDSDDTLALNALEITSSLIIKYNVDFITYNSYFIENDHISNFPYSDLPHFLYLDDIFKAYCQYDYEGSLCNKLFKRELINKLIEDNFNNENIIGEDMIFSFKLSYIADSLLYIPLGLYYVRKRNTSTSNTFNMRYLEDINKMLSELNKYINDKKINKYDKYYNTFFTIYIKTMYVAMVSLSKNDNNKLENINNFTRKIILENIDKTYIDEKLFVDICKKYNYYYLLKLINKDQTRPDQTRPDQTRPDQTRINICSDYIYIYNNSKYKKLQPMLQYYIAA